MRGMKAWMKRGDRSEKKKRAVPSMSERDTKELASREKNYMKERKKELARESRERRGAATAEVERTEDSTRGTRQREYKNKGHEGQKERESPQRTDGGGCVARCIPNPGDLAT